MNRALEPLKNMVVAGALFVLSRWKRRWLQVTGLLISLLGPELKNSH